MDRNVPLKRATPLTASRLSPVPGPVRLGTGKTQVKNAAARKTGLAPVSSKRARENRERAKMADRRWPDRRDGTVMCGVPGCTRPADDLGEILPRGRGGSITDEENTMPQCRSHNEELTKSPGWAYRLGVLKHDGLCCRGRKSCERYSQDGEVA